jgi:hypothetical protein
MQLFFTCLSAAIIDTFSDVSVYNYACTNFQPRINKYSYNKRINIKPLGFDETPVRSNFF